MTTTDEDAWKDRSRKQWSADPCGSTTVKTTFGTKEYFEELERVRYQEYASWMKEDIGFDRHAGERLLEVGVGMGSDHAQWARGGAVCTGIDLTPKCIEITKQRFELYGLRSDLRVMDAEKLDFPSESFDLVYSFGVLHHTPGTQEAIDEIHRVLKPGGRAIVMLYHRDSLHVMKLAMSGIEGAFAEKSLHDMLGEGEAAVDRKALPLTKIYSRSEAMFLFRRFQKADNIVRQLNRSELGAPFFPPGSGLAVTPKIALKVLFDSVARRVGSGDQPLPDKVISEIGAILGWNVVVFAQK
jgi:SAM-dependent methyltransferase